MPIAVHEPIPEIAELRKEWAVIEPLLSGTLAMRAAGHHLLPHWPNEDAEAYKLRLATATLFPAYRRTVSVMASKPFSKPLTLNQAPKAIESWSTDVDMEGTSLHRFAAEMFDEVMGYGLAGILVDHPPADPDPGRTRAKAQAQGLRPYWVRVRHGQILGWRAALGPQGMQLTQLRLMESVDEADGDWGVKSVEQVRVLTPGTWATYRKNTRGEWGQHASGTTTLSVVPFVPLYGFRRSFMVGAPALADLAHLNVKHWQSQSDQDNILHVARVPILAVMGVDDERWQLTVGASSAVKLPENGDMKFVEHTGAAIEAGAKSLSALEEQMVQTGAELMVQKPGARTATEDANDAEGNKCDLQRIAESFADALDQALYLTGQYLRTGENSGNVHLFDDYGAGTLSDASAVLVKDLQGAGLLSKETTLREMQRRGVINADIDVADEIERAAADGPALGEVGAGGDPQEAVQQLNDAIALHEKHMNGTAPTTGPAGEKSQQLMMDQMIAARDALTGNSTAPMPAMGGM